MVRLCRYDQRTTSSVVFSAAEDSWHSVLFPYLTAIRVPFFTVKVNGVLVKIYRCYALCVIAHDDLMSFTTLWHPLESVT